MNESNLGNKEIFSRNLKRYLAISGKTQREVAAVVGVSISTFCDWANGRLYPRMNKIQKLADFFGVKKSDLVEDVNVSKETVSDKAQFALDMFEKLSDDRKDFFIKMLQVELDNQ